MNETLTLIELLRGAGAAASPVERESLNDRALQLAAKLVVTHGTVVEPIGQTHVTVNVGGPYRLASQALVLFLADAVRAVAVVNRNDTLIVMGDPNDVDVFEVLQQSLHTQSLEALKQWWKAYAGTHTNAEGVRHRRQFLIQFAQTNCELLARYIERELPADGSEALTRRKAAALAALAERFPARADG